MVDQKIKRDATNASRSEAGNSKVKIQQKKPYNFSSFPNKHVAVSGQSTMSSLYCLYVTVSSNNRSIRLSFERVIILFDVKSKDRKTKRKKNKEQKKKKIAKIALGILLLSKSKLSCKSPVIEIYHRPIWARANPLCVETQANTPTLFNRQAREGSSLK